jgi:hypothetical protein
MFKQHLSYHFIIYFILIFVYLYILYLMRKNTKLLNNLIKRCFSSKDNKDVSGMTLNEK